MVRSARTMADYDSVGTNTAIQLSEKSSFGRFLSGKGASHERHQLHTTEGLDT